MADNLPVSQLQDKTGNTYDIAAKRFSGTRTFTLTGDVTGSVTDNFSGNVAISVGIADNAIDTSCIADGAVTVSKIADTAVTESKLSTELQTKIDTASDASHTHSNKALLDTYTQTEANLADAVSKKHSHANSAVLSKYAGSKGSASVPVYIASDGTPTACTDDFARDSEVTLKEDKSNKVTSWSATTTNAHYPSEKLVKTSLDGKQATLPTTGTASSTYAINISGKAATATSATSDGLGQNIVDTYATKIEVNDKNWLKAVSIPAGGTIDGLTDISNVPGVFYHRGNTTDVGGTYPSGVSGNFLLRTESRDRGLYRCIQTLYTTDQDFYYVRIVSSPNYGDWKKVYYESTSTYSATGTAPVNGAAIKSALDGQKLAQYSITSRTGSVWIKFDTNNNQLGNARVEVIGVRNSDGISFNFEFNPRMDGGNVTCMAINNSINTGLNLLKTFKFYKYVSGNTTQVVGSIENSTTSSYTIRVRVVSSTAVYIVDQALPTSGLTAGTMSYRSSVYNPSDTAVGSASQPVHIDADGSVLACTTANLMAGKDADGNTITSTYATKSEVDDKNYLKAVNLTSSSNIDNLPLPTTDDYVSYYSWGNVTVGGTLPAGSTARYCLLRHERIRGTNTDFQTLYIASQSNLYFVRSKANNIWGDWNTVYYTPRKSNDVASFTTDDNRAYTGKAIAEYVAGAIGGNVGGYMGECSKADIYTSTTNFHNFKLGDWFVASEAGTYTYRVDGTNKTLANVTVGAEIYFTTDKTLEVKPTAAYELTVNKAASIDSSTTKYPTNNAVKTYVDSGISSLSDTYATKTEVNNKSYLKATLLTSADDLDALTSLGGKVTCYTWINSSIPANVPETGKSGFLTCRGHDNTNITQEVTLAAAYAYKWVRVRSTGGWGSWMKVYYEATSTYDATGTQAVNGTAVAAALSTAIAPKVSVEAAQTGVSYQFLGATSSGDRTICESPYMKFYHDTSLGLVQYVGIPAESGNANKGQILLSSASANGYSRISSSATTERNVSFPNKNGTILVDADVASTYSATGTAPVNGKAVASALTAKQDNLPTSGTASTTYAINISGNAATATNSTKLNGQSASYYAKQSDMGATYISATETLKFTGLSFS